MEYVLFSTGRASGLEARHGTIGESLGTQVWQDIDCLPEGPKITEILRNGSYLLACPLQHLFRAVGRRGQKLGESLLAADRERWMVLFVIHDSSRPIGGRKSGTGGWLFWDLDDPSHILLSFALHLLRGDVPERFADGWLVGQETQGKGLDQRDQSVKALKRVAAGEIEALRSAGRPSLTPLAKAFRQFARGPDGSLEVQEDIEVEGLDLVDFTLLSAVVARMSGGQGLFSYGTDLLQTSSLIIVPALRQATGTAAPEAAIVQRRGERSTRSALASIDLATDLADVAEATLEFLQLRRRPTPVVRTADRPAAKGGSSGDLDKARLQAQRTSASKRQVEVRRDQDVGVLRDVERNRLLQDISATIESVTAYVDQRVEQGVRQIAGDRSRWIWDDEVQRVIAECVDRAVAERVRVHEKRLRFLEQLVQQPPVERNSVANIRGLLLLAIVANMLLLLIVSRVL